MKQERQIEELARIDGLELRGVYWYRGEVRVSRGIGLLPDYLNDHNAIQRIIDGLPEKYALRYVTSLGDCIKRNIEWGIVGFLGATCEQKAEAILRAYDKWEEE